MHVVANHLIFWLLTLLVVWILNWEFKDELIKAAWNFAGGFHRKKLVSIITISYYSFSLDLDVRLGFSADTSIYIVTLSQQLFGEHIIIPLLWRKSENLRHKVPNVGWHLRRMGKLIGSSAASLRGGLRAIHDAHLQITNVIVFLIKVQCSYCMHVCSIKILLTFSTDDIMSRNHWTTKSYISKIFADKY